ncbi:FmdB family zinc ribbon protein [Luteococcus sp. H138]|uniref:FmdB family zinc ribbon protein n=1 Tax=unclassified Luteococcus TaxID=2639923 RepID=UPI00313A9FB3
MPTYQYRCTECGVEIERVQKFSDPALTVCEDCGGALRKLYNAVGIVFKGSGFYATDNRTKGSSAAAAPASTGGESGATKPDQSSPKQGPKESKPAAGTASSSASSTASSTPAS